MDSLPEDILARLAALDTAGLHARRAELISKGTPSDLNDTDLQELVEIHSRLRRGASGPPSTATKRSSKKPPQTLEALEALLG